VILPSRVLPPELYWTGHQAQPGGELTTALEVAALADHRQQRSGRGLPVELRKTPFCVTGT
jgi:hypothetical protein